MEALNILIADDHYIIRRGVRQIIADEFPSAYIAEASTSQETMEMVWKQEWHLVILDINLPGRDGLEVLKDIKRERPAAQVIVLALHSVDHFAVRCCATELPATFPANASGKIL